MRSIRINNKAVDPNITFNFSKYRKKPVLIEAVQINEPFEVDTLEGMHQGNAGDYLIRGIEGEFYPCKPSIFKKTYDKE